MRTRCRRTFVNARRTSLFHPLIEFSAWILRRHISGPDSRTTQRSMIPRLTPFEELALPAIYVSHQPRQSPGAAAPNLI